jgi:hypothetical protein
MKIKFESPAISGNTGMMALWAMMEAQKVIMEANLKKYMPLQYQMMKSMREAMERGSD